MMTIEQAEKLANHPIAVAAHKFHPFIRFESQWTQFAIRGNKGKDKTRNIHYAARSDAYIYMRYRALLSELYEELLKSGPLNESVLAYRKIQSETSNSGKCNIHFASEAFEYIRKQKNCCAIALDISDYFGSIDHKMLEAQLLKLIKNKKLPPDLLAVFRNITEFSEVDKIKVYERLGFFGALPNSPEGKNFRGYLKPKHEIRERLCDIASFREKIAGGNSKPSIIQKNSKKRGIPQGSPISDVLANIYLHEFDLHIHDAISKLGGRYTRYSDDILIIAPVDIKKALELETWLRELIPQFGPKLKIKQTKSLILQFYEVEDHQKFNVIYDGKWKTELVRFMKEDLVEAKKDINSPESKKILSDEYDRGRIGLNGFEYLGFRFDGNGIYLRDSTFANLKRKIRTRSRSAAKKFVRERITLNIAALSELFKLEKKRIMESFGRVRNFESSVLNPQDWTFTTYAKRISAVLDPKYNRVDLQLRNLKKVIGLQAEISFSEAIAKLK